MKRFFAKVYAKFGPRRIAALTTAAGFGIVGIILLLSGMAATPVVSVEAEQGTRSGIAETVNDVAASGGSAVRFKVPLTGEPTLSRSVLVTGLNNPWDLGFLPDGTMFMTERSGAVKVRTSSGTVRLLVQIGDVVVRGEGGLLGLAVDPEFAANRYIYTCFSSNKAGTADNRLVRWTVNAAMDGMAERADIVTGMPYSTGRHSGCRPRFAPDGYLWVGTGDVAVGTHPQNKQSLGGKVLRIDRNGTGAPGNAGTGFDHRIYTWGQRNVQGLAFRPGTNQAFSVEHGPDRDDELMLLKPGGNGGWDPIPGYNEAVPMTDTNKFPQATRPTRASGSPTIAPSGSTSLTGGQWRDWNGALAMAVLKGTHLRVFLLNQDGTAVVSQKSVLQNGIRLRTAVQGPDGNLYLTTDVGSGGGEVWKVVPQ